MGQFRVATAGCGVLFGLFILASTATIAAAEDDDAAEIDSENIFGFTSGSDVNEAGEQEVEFGLTGAFGRQREAPGSSRFRAWEAEIEYAYGVTPDMTLGLGASFAHFDIRNIAELEDTRAGGFNGLSAGLKYRFQSWQDAPFGLALSIEPEWSRHEDGSGELADSYELPITLILDRELSPGKLWGALNLTYAPEWTHGDEGTEKEASLELAGALSWQVSDGVFLGGELRYLTSYEGVALKHREGEALYAGPSLYMRLSDQAYVKAAVSWQVSGSSPESEGSRDLVDHERQMVTIGAGFEF
ncbi:MAG: hypothetical protein QM656_18015 [Paracoccaceae bacterium]